MYQFLYELLMKVVATPTYLQTAQNRHTQKGQITQDVQDLVPHEFLRES